jgi:hypothetical protein
MLQGFQFIYPAWSNIILISVLEITNTGNSHTKEVGLQ